MVTDRELIAGVKAAFGDSSYFEDGALNRKHIAAIVFNDKEQLARLNAMVHPATFRAFDEWVNAIKDVPYVLKEAALLFESDSYKMCDYSIMVQAPFQLRLKRVMERDSLSRAEVESRESKQFSEEKKAALADYIIINDDVQLLIPQVLELHQKFLSLGH